MIAAATTPTKLSALHGVVNIEPSMVCMSMVDDPFLVLWSRLRLVDVKCSAMVSVSCMSRVTWTVVYVQGKVRQMPFVGTWVLVSLCIVMVPFAELLASRSLFLS